jgi:hypothetical protein
VRAARTVAVTTAPLAGRARWPAALAWALWALTRLGLAVAAWLDLLLRQAGGPDLASPGAAIIPEVVAAVTAATVGAVLAGRRPRHPVGWLLLGQGLLVPGSDSASAYAHYGVMVRAGRLPAAGYLAGLSNGLFFLWFSLAGFVLLLTPTGSLPSPRWRWWARLAAAAAAVQLLANALDPHPLVPEDPTFHNPLAPPDPVAGPLGMAAGVGFGITLAALLAAAWSLVLRLRRARGIERQQLRWLALAAALAALAVLVGLGGALVASSAGVVAAAGTCVALLPLATGAAILRYRLYDLDRIVSRTLAYGLLTLLLGGVYAAVVLAPAQLFGGVGGEPGWVVAAATLAVAALFRPVRRRVQTAVDRRFDRRRYDAARTIEGFSVRLRQQLDLDSLTAELLAVVEQTMQPTRTTLWLRPQQPPQPPRGAGRITPPTGPSERR